jgi:putative colanic acid biosynthesis acetyltransferase WcaF
MEDKSRWPEMSFDIRANRAARKWNKNEWLGRAAWGLIRPLFRFSPRPLWQWRVLLLRLFGARIGSRVNIHPSVLVEIPWNLRIGSYCAIGDRAILYNLGMVQIGSATTLSQGAHLCAGTHDYRKAEFPLVKSPISIGDNVWICADAFIGPGVKIEDRVIVGARAVVIRDVTAGSIVAGNPAVAVRRRQEAT